ncbi:GDP-mannose 4,6-dehydratase [Candidatus Woesearchaeota archaeon]|nr:GDP-mannose 4,6-dehydratase [Candidatus Woesearchaeota archaeon]
MKKSLITGITGFVGSHLAELLLKEGHKVSGICRWRSPLDNIAHIQSKLNLINADLLDSHSMEKAVNETKPDFIFHLAAQSYVPESWNAPNKTLQINILGEANLFEAVRKANINPVIQIAGSSEEYGFVLPEETPIKETNPLRPLSPYGVSKVAQDLLGYQYFKSYGLKIIRTRAFNHTGPRRGQVFVVSDWSKQIAEIEKGKRKPMLNVGNLNAQRDFSDVRDIVRAYLLAVEKGIPGEVYNISSGKAWKMKDILDSLLRMTNKKITVKKDPSKIRPSDVEILIGDCTKFKEQTGWEPKIDFTATLRDTLEYWRQRV